MNIQKKWWQLSVDETCQRLNTDCISGLSFKEVKERLTIYGLNQLPRGRPISALHILLKQFMSFVVWVLIAAIIISLALQQWPDAIAIAAIVILNALIGFFQEYSAERSLAALRRLTKPTTRVLREGETLTIPSYELVPGDLVLLDAGDVIPADGRVVLSHELTTDEAPLTGESVPVVKTDQILSAEKLIVGDQANMAFMGTTVVGGRGRLMVTHTGATTQLGMIATFIETAEPEPETALQLQMKRLAYILLISSIVIAVIVCILGFIRSAAFMPLFLTVVSLMVAAVPEGLPAMITITLANAVKKIARRNGLVRRLSTVETLGYVSVICADKTGTLTQNRMMVRSIWVAGGSYSITGSGYAPIGQFKQDHQSINPSEHPGLMTALTISVLCNNAALQQSAQSGEWSITGDPTEGALLTAAGKAGLEKQVLEDEHRLIKEFAFDSQRKRMSVLRARDEAYTLYVKGAADSVLTGATHVLINGKEEPLTPEKKKEIMLVHDSYAQDALRVLGVAYKSIDTVTSDSGVDQAPNSVFSQDSLTEDNLVFVGLFAMMDPPRPEARAALETSKKAGIRTLMLTGDHATTARAVAQEIGLIDQHAQLITGVELDALSDDELKKILTTTSVYARISVGHKIRIVEALKAQGSVVAMTGDGVNDAPALKIADVGIAMGITGTDVTKEASDMVITDDNFASIVSAIEEGRSMYDTVAKFVKYLLSSNMAELLVVLGGFLYQFIDPLGRASVTLLPMQILWINLISDGLPVLALAFDPVHRDVMRRKPAFYRAPLLTFRAGIYLLLLSFILSGGVMGAYLYGLRTSADMGHSMAFTTLVVLEFVRLQMVRAEYQLGPLTNFWVLFAVGTALLMQLALLYVPALQAVFKTVGLGVNEWLVILAMTVIVAIIYGILHLFQTKKILNG